MITIKMIKGNQIICQEILRIKINNKIRRRHCQHVARYLIDYHGIKLYVCKQHKKCYAFLKKMDSA